MRVERPSPRLVRVTVAGEALEGFDPDPGPAAHMKVFVPVDGSDDLAMRTYTVRRFDPDALELDVEFLLHGDGPASTWADRCAPGDVLTLAGPRSTYRPDPAAAWRVLAGDESALPAIASILESQTGVPTRVLAEVADADEAQAWPLPASTDVEWLPRGDAAPGARLVQAVEELSLPAGEGEFWVGCEASAMRAIRGHLLDERGLARSAIRTRGYWMVGEVNHPDNDTGET